MKAKKEQEFKALKKRKRTNGDIGDALEAAFKKSPKTNKVVHKYMVKHKGSRFWAEVKK